MSLPQGFPIDRGKSKEGRDKEKMGFPQHSNDYKVAVIGGGRAGIGRCQGGLCGLPVLSLLAKQLGVGCDQVTKKGKRSYPIVSALCPGEKGLYHKGPTDSG